MPKAMEDALKKKASKMFGAKDSKKANAFVYGTMRKTGWKPGQGKQMTSIIGSQSNG